MSDALASGTNLPPPEIFLPRCGVRASPGAGYTIPFIEPGGGMSAKKRKILGFVRIGPASMGDRRKRNTRASEGHVWLKALDLRGHPVSADVDTSQL